MASRLPTEAVDLVERAAGESRPGAATPEMPWQWERRVASLFAGDLRTIFLGALRAGDILVVILGAIAAFRLWHGSTDLPAFYWGQVVTACFLAAQGLHFARIYSIASLRRRTQQLARVGACWAATLLATIALLYFTKIAEDVSRAWMLLWAATSFGGFVMLRIAAWICLARWGRRGTLHFNVAVIGQGAAADELARRIRVDAKDDVQVLGTFRPDAAAVNDATAGNVTDLVQLSRRTRIDEIAVALSSGDAPGLEASLRAVTSIPADVKLCIDLPYRGPLGVVSVPLLPVLLARRPLAGWQMVIKRGVDVALSLVLILLLGPLMLLIAFMIRCGSPGPAIFRQRRVGFNKQLITVYKFRTMRWERAEDPSVPQARRGDPRVTRLGHLLRRSSLDELPQLFNVLLGNMSLVGPRPHAIVHDEKYATLIDGYLARHRVKPGITGWAQVNGFRGETETVEKMRRRLEHDLFYIDHWSPLFDLRILARTLTCGFIDPNAY